MKRGEDCALGWSGKSSETLVPFYPDETIDGLQTDFKPFPRTPLSRRESLKRRPISGAIFSSDASPMNCAEEHERPINQRRYQRYEIDTQLHVTVLGVEQRGTMRLL